MNDIQSILNTCVNEWTRYYADDSVIIGTLNRLAKELGTKSANEKWEFVWTNYKQLADIIKRPASNLVNARRNNLMHTVLSWNSMLDKMEARCTRLFNKFIKGITNFSNHQEHQPYKPSYHRRESCSYTDNLDVLREAYTCDGKTVTEIQERKDRVKLCFIERVIYDKLYTHCIQHSNIGHNYQAYANMAMYYDSCFKTEPKTSRTLIDIKFTNNHVPIELSIVYVDYSTGKTVSTEKYLRHLRTEWEYQDKVECIKEENKTFFTKTQTFGSGDQIWVKQDPQPNTGYIMTFHGGKKVIRKRNVMKKKKPVFISSSEKDSHTVYKTNRHTTVYHKQ